MKSSYKGFVALAIVVIEISLWSVFLQIGGKNIGLLPELFYGFLIGSVVSIGISLTKDKGKGLASIIKRKDMLLIMLFAGLLNDVLTQLFLGIGTLGTNPAIGGIVYRSWVILVALLTPLVLKQRVKPKQMLATIIGFLGIYIILSGGTLSAFSSTESGYVGVLILSALCSTGSILIMNRYNVDTAGAIALFNIISLVIVAALVVTTHTSINVAFTPSTIISILFLGIVAYGIGTMLYYYSVKILGPLITGNSILSVPFLTIAFSFLLVGTQIKLYYIAAALLASVGIVLQRRYSSIPEHISSNKSLNQLYIFDVTGVFATSNGHEIREKMNGKNRAFAIRSNDSEFNSDLHKNIFLKRDCIVFTTSNPHGEVKSEEVRFISDVMELRKNEMALIGIGDPRRLEDAFEEFVFGKLAPQSP